MFLEGKDLGANPKDGGGGGNVTWPEWAADPRIRVLLRN